MTAMLLPSSSAVSAELQPQDGLNWQSQETRDAAAEGVRTALKPTPRAKWEPALEALRNLVDRDSVIALLEALGATDVMLVRSGQTSNESFRLDDEWEIHCHFSGMGSHMTLHAADLIESMQHVWIAPPDGFTGSWRTYFVNGRVSHEIEYVAGAYSGSLTSYRPDGSKAVVQHYRNGVAHGDDIGYFPSGAIQYRGRYESDVRVGEWVHYDENGAVRSRDKEVGDGPR